MKKFFTLVCALMGFAVTGNAAATVDDISVCKHSYVFIADDYTNNGTLTRVKGTLFGDNHFLDVTGGSIATNKGAFDLSVADGILVTDEIAAKYGEYGSHLNSLRLKNAQDVIAMKVTAKSKLIIFYQNNGGDRYPLFASDAAIKSTLSVQGEKTETVNKCARMEWTAPDDMLVYIGSQGGDMFISYIIVEANEAPGTPTVKVGPQSYENGLWFKEVTCKANDCVEEGSTESIPTIVTYTTDGTTPTAASTKYTEPIKCYKDMVVKFQAFMDIVGDGVPSDDFIAEGADNEGNVNFAFNAPTITADGANVTITSEYEGAENYYSYGDVEDAKGSSFTLSESATVTAYSQIVNGSYQTFTTKPVSTDVYVLNAIKEKKTITVAGTAVLDEEATAASTTGEKIYKIENGAITADKMDFFVKNLEFGVVTSDNSKYQAPEGQEAYIKMNATNISFMIAAGNSVDVVVTCSKNSCKTINEENDETVTTDRKCYVNVSGTTYGTDDITEKDGHIIKFGLKAGETDQIFTFQKYSGTGNILISSIEIAPVTGTGIGSVIATEESVDAPAYNLAGQKVDANYKGIVIKGGKKYMNK